MRLTFLCVLVACGDRKPVTAPITAPMPAPVVEPATPPVTSPHTGGVQLVATTDRGDAALSVDNHGAVRLWPALDGSIEPVVVHAAAPKQLALARDGTGLVAAILDDAGGVELIRFDARGGLRGRAKLPPDPAAEDVVFARGHAVVRRSDESLARFDLRGIARGVLMADAGHRIVSIATRRDRVIAGVGATAATHVRFVTDTFAWEPAIALPVPLVDLALAPGHRRIAGYAEDTAAKIIELAPSVRLLGSVRPKLHPMFPRKGGPAAAPEPAIVGFVDDDHVVTSGPGLRWAAAPTWNIMERDQRHPDSHAAIGDVVIAGSSAGLMLESQLATRYLGYRALGGEAILDGARVLATGSREVFWLDDQLRSTRVTKDSDLYQPPGPPPSVEFALDDSHLLLTQTQSYDSKAKQRVLIHDVQTKQSVEIGMLDHGHSYNAFDRGTNVFAVRVDPLVQRFRIDSPTTATHLRPLAGAADSILPIFLTDPAKANGIVAVVAPTTPHVKLFADGPGTAPIAARKVPIPSGRVIAVDRAANVYVTTRDALHVLHPDGSPPERLAIAGVWFARVSEDGQALALLLGRHSVALFDRAGTERWRVRVEAARKLAFRDGAVVVGTESGLVSLDVRTGARIAAVCGWGFGLYEGSDLAMAPNVPSACADGR